MVNTKTRLDYQSHAVRRPRPIRTCYLIDNLSLAGTETQLLALIRHLNRERVQPYLCLLNGTSPESIRLEPADCTILRLGVRSLCRPGTVVKAWQFARFLQRHRIDVLQSYFPDSTYFGAVVGGLAGVPVIVRARNNLGHWLTPVHRILGRALHPLLSCTITNCNAGRVALIDAERNWRHRITIVENGIDLERFQSVPPLSQTGDEPFTRVGIIANLRAVKRIDLVLEAAAIARATLPSLHIRVAGEGVERARLEAQIQRLGLSNNAELIGAVKDVPRFLDSIQIAVLSSDAEGMSNALLEYAAAGRAIVATEVGAASELLGHGKHGLLVPKGDPRALAQALIELCLDPARAIRLGTNARRHAWQCYGRAAMVARMERLYHEWLNVRCTLPTSHARVVNGELT